MISIRSLGVTEIALRWFARLCGLALFLLVAAIVIGEGIDHGLPNPFQQPPSVAIQLFLMPIMTIGLIVAWRWELPGALATLIAWVGFNVVNLLASGKLAGGAFPLFAATAMLYLLHAALRWRLLSSPRPSA